MHAAGLFDSTKIPSKPPFSKAVAVDHQSMTKALDLAVIFASYYLYEVEYPQASEEHFSVLLTVYCGIGKRSQHQSKCSNLLIKFIIYDLFNMTSLATLSVANYYYYFAFR